MKMTIVGRMERVDASAIVSLLSKSILTDGQAETFAGQPVATLVAPSRDVPASVHFMYFPPGSAQPVHKHPGDRLLLVVAGSPVVVTFSSDYQPLTEPVFETQTVDPNGIAAIVIPEGTWHRFSVGTEGCGAVAFSFHPLDKGDPDTNFADTGLMERLTSFLT